MALSACTATPATPPPSPVARLSEYLDGLVQRQEFRGAVRVQLGDQVLINRGYDKADPTGAANGPDTRFRIASLTKQFTALAVLKLNEQGKLAVADPVCKYVPRCPQAWSAISIQQLLTHTSGLVSLRLFNEAEIAAYLAKVGTRPTPEQLVRETADRPLDFPPGSRWSYSNAGFTLLGYVIELVSGQDYGSFLRQQILDPLGMKDSGYPDPTDGRPVAIGYANWSTPAGDSDPVVSYAAGGLYSTTNDLARWNHFLATGTPPVVSRETLAQLVLPRPKIDDQTHYGYGIFIRGTAEKPIYSHTGQVPGYTSYNAVQPATSLSVTVLSNLNTANPDQIGDKLVNLATD